MSLSHMHLTHVYSESWLLTKEYNWVKAAICVTHDWSIYIYIHMKQINMEWWRNRKHEMRQIGARYVTDFNLHS